MFSGCALRAYARRGRRPASGRRFGFRHIRSLMNDAQNPCMIDTPDRRYGPLSDMLSGVRLLPPKDGQNSVNPGNHRFCNIWSANDVSRIFLETGALHHWKDQGFRDLIVDIPPQNHPARHALEIWTAFDGVRELLMQAVVWLDLTHIEEFDCVIPCFCVEHLRLQTPAAQRSRDLLPGQDFPSSGQLRRIFGILRYCAISCGSAAMTEIPEYFHTAYIFSRFFSYIDRPMEATFGAMRRDLIDAADLRRASLHETVARVSRAFEEEKILCNGSIYRWPTELQIYPLDPDLACKFRRHIPPSQETFSTIE